MKQVQIVNEPGCIAIQAGGDIWFPSGAHPIDPQWFEKPEQLERYQIDQSKRSFLRKFLNLFR